MYHSTIFKDLLEVIYQLTPVDVENGCKKQLYVCVRVIMNQLECNHNFVVISND